MEMSKNETKQTKHLENVQISNVAQDNIDAEVTERGACICKAEVCTFPLSNSLFLYEFLVLTVVRRGMKENLTFSVTNSWDFTTDCSYSNVYIGNKLQLIKSSPKIEERSFKEKEKKKKQLKNMSGKAFQALMQQGFYIRFVLPLLSRRQPACQILFQTSLSSISAENQPY